MSKSRASLLYNDYYDDASYCSDDTADMSTLESEYAYDDEAQTSYGSSYGSEGHSSTDRSDVTSRYSGSTDDESVRYFKRRKSRKPKYDYIDAPQEGKSEKCAVSCVMKFLKKSDAMYETELLNFLTTNYKGHMKGGPVARKKYTKLFTIASPVIVNIVFIIISVLVTSDAGLISSMILLLLSIVYVFRKLKKCRKMCHRYGTEEKNARRRLKHYMH
ncbi:hypothetical protein PVNG_06583 [Plasmodium vivax North Korean]|nr:hypothetical protein PVNG_06583 [Plasmodium vivax North Korean]